MEVDQGTDRVAQHAGKTGLRYSARGQAAQSQTAVHSQGCKQRQRQQSTQHCQSLVIDPLEEQRLGEQALASEQDGPCRSH